MSGNQSILYYFHDPMCSWCWGFVPVLNVLMAQLPENIEVKRIVGGLAADSQQPMSDEMKEYIKGNWRKILQVIPGSEFNFAFWEECQPRRSTYPACRAVIAARQQGQQYDRLMTSAIQRAYYKQARNPSDDQTLIELAAELGLDVDEFSSALNSNAVNQHLRDEIDLTAKMFVESLPSMVLDTDGSQHAVLINYTDHLPMLKFIQQKLNEK